MYIIISDNLEGYSDHLHNTVLVCETEEQAKKASALLLAWVRKAADYYRKQNKVCYEEVEIPPCGVDAYYLHIPSVYTTDKEFDGTISYFEVPKWAE